MPRRRMIDPDIWHDVWFGRLSYTEQIFFIGIISNADDEGRILADPAYLRSRIFIYQDIPLDTISQMITKFQDTNHNFISYGSNGSSYICLRKWKDYQKPEYAKPSKIPPPPDTESGQPNQSPNDSPNQSPNDSPPSIVEYSIVEASIVKGKSPKNNITLLLNALRAKYPDLNVDDEWEKCKLWWSEGNRKMKRPQSALRNWLEKAHQFKLEKTNGHNQKSNTAGQVENSADKYTSGKYGHLVQR